MSSITIPELIQEKINFYIWAIDYKKVLIEYRQRVRQQKCYIGKNIFYHDMDYTNIGDTILLFIPKNWSGTKNQWSTRNKICHIDHVATTRTRTHSYIINDRFHIRNFTKKSTTLSAKWTSTSGMIVRPYGSILKMMRSVPIVHKDGSITTKDLNTFRHYPYNP